MIARATECIYNVFDLIKDKGRRFFLGDCNRVSRVILRTSVDTASQSLHRCCRHSCVMVAVATQLIVGGVAADTARW